MEAGTVDVSVEDEAYIALWHTNQFELDLAKLYRIRILVGTQELGHADVQPVSNGSELKNLDTGEVIGLVGNRTLAIRFRIEEGALGITIDATALSARGFTLGGLGSFPSATPVVLDLAPGTYSITDGSVGTHAFEITSDGLIAYASEKDPFFDGSGTTQLTVVGYDVVIDATALTSTSFSLGGIGSFSTTITHSVTMLPGNKSFTSTEIVFGYEVLGDGLLDYDASLDAALTGRNSDVLIISP